MKPIEESAIVEFFVDEAKNFFSEDRSRVSLACDEV